MPGPPKYAQHTGHLASPGPKYDGVSGPPQKVIPLTAGSDYKALCRSCKYVAYKNDGFGSGR